MKITASKSRPAHIRIGKYKGFTLVEAIIFIFLFSMLLAGYMRYSWDVNMANAKFYEDIIEKQSK